MLRSHDGQQVLHQIQNQTAAERADANVKHRGKTGLDLAVDLDDHRIIETLLVAGASIESPPPSPTMGPASNPHAVDTIG